MNWTVNDIDVKRSTYRRIGPLIVVTLLLTVSCAGNKPPNLTPDVLPIWQANESIVAIGMFQEATIGLNSIQVCEPLPCHPLVSDDNTRKVVTGTTSAIRTIRQLPNGWRATSIAALLEIEQQLDAAGKTKLAAYLQAARLILGGI